MLPHARYTTHKLTIDFGEELGQRISGARVVRYSPEQLLGKLVIGVVNLPAKNIGKLRSEVLILGVPGADGECVLLAPDGNVPLGGKVY
jgi:tRNA-binding protein